MGNKEIDRLLDDMDLARLEAEWVEEDLGIPLEDYIILNRFLQDGEQEDGDDN